MNATKLDWNDGNFLSNEELRTNHTRIMAVSDDYVTSLAIIPDTMTPYEALEEYASTYESRSVGDEIKVSWVLYDDGKEVATGSWTFAARRGN